MKASSLYCFCANSAIMREEIKGLVTELNYQETLHDLHSIPRKLKENHLHNITRLMERLGNPQQRLRCIHVAGTNGKGSVSKMIAHSLTESGYRVGLFTSPFIIDFRERIQIDGRYIEEEEVVRFYKQVRDAAVRLESEGFDTVSEFEVVTAMAFLYFYEMEVELCVIEVGIGGRYDATNLIDPELSVITSISKDHMSQLGNTLEEIAWHKAGIIKTASVISSEQTVEVQRVFQNAAERMNTNITFASSSMYRFLGMKEHQQRIEFSIPHYEPFNVDLNLLGTYQMENAAVAVMALLKLQTLGFEKITVDSIRTALNTVTWIGRMEIVRESPLTIADGAHNEDGARRIIESIQFYFPDRKILLLLGMLKDKDITAVVNVLTSRAKSIYLHTPEDPRALSETLLLEKISSDVPVECCSTLRHAYEKAQRDFEEEDLILSAGSLYTIGEMKKISKNS